MTDWRQVFGTLVLIGLVFYLSPIVSAMVYIVARMVGQGKRRGEDSG